MGFGLNKLVKVGTLGLVPDITGEDAATAANARIQAGTQAGIAEQRRQFDVTQETLRPSIEAGDLAREQQLALLGLSGTEAQQAAWISAGHGAAIFDNPDLTDPGNEDFTLQGVSACIDSVRSK